MVKKINESYRYWSNCCGDLFTPLPENRNIDENELPDQLQWIFKNIWTESLGFRCYLTQLDEKFGISLEDEWSRETAEVYDLSYEEYLAYAKPFAERISMNFPRVKVMFSRDYQEWNDGSKESILAVFISYDQLQLYGKGLFDNIAKFMDEEHPIHEIKRMDEEKTRLKLLNESKTVSIKLPDGRKLVVTPKDVEGDYPGFCISWQGNGEEDIVACVEYNSDAKELRTEVYKQGADEPCYIIGEDGEDHV